MPLEFVHFLGHASSACPEREQSPEENSKRYGVFARPLWRRLDVQPVLGELPLQWGRRAEEFDVRDLALFQPARRRERIDVRLARIATHREGVEPVALGSETNVLAGEVDAFVFVEVLLGSGEAAAGRGFAGARA